jgi:hypothetical protein
MIDQYTNVKSGALVTRKPDYKGQAVIMEGRRKRTIALDRFERDYELIEGEPEQLFSTSHIKQGLGIQNADTRLIEKTLSKPIENKALSEKPLSPDYGPRRMNEEALNRQKLAITGSRRKDLTASDRNEMAAPVAHPAICR